MNLYPKRPVVSIITPCWNAARFLGQTYESLRRQSLADWEWIIADDGSTDDSMRVALDLQGQDSRVRVIPCPHRGLPATGRNVGLRHARGEFVAFLDSDDLFHPEKLERQVGFLRTNPRVGATYSFVQEFWDSAAGRTGKPPVFWPSVPLPRNAFAFLLARGNVVCTSSLLVRRSILGKIGHFDDGDDLRGVEDFDFILRVARRFRIARTPGVLVRYRIHKENTTRQIDLNKAEAVKKRLETRGHLRGAAGRAFLSTHYMIRAEYGLEGAQGTNARADFMRSFLHQPLNPRRWIGLGSLVMPTSLFARLYRALKRLQSRMAGKRASPHRMAVNDDA